VAALRSLERHRPPKERPMPEPATATVTEPVPPVPVVVTTRAEPDDPEVRVLGREDSVRAWMAERTKHPKEFAALRLGDCLRAMITGPRNDLERRVLSEGTDSAGGFTVPDVLMAEWIDRLRNALTVVRAGARTVPLTSDVTKIARLLADPTAAWRAENAAVAESDPSFEAVTFTPRSLDVFFKTSRELVEDSINASEILEAALVRSFAVEVDRVCLAGTGTPPQPRGIRNTTNVNEVSQGTNGAALTSYDPILDLLALCWADNVTMIDTAIMAPRTLATLSKLKTGITNDKTPLARPAVLADWSFLQSANVSIAETQGSASDASTLYLGDWTSMLLGFRTQMQVEVARELFRGNYQFGFFGHLRFDMQVTHPESFGRLIGIIP
jgi:HK97 family phage major capsid protein